MRNVTILRVAMPLAVVVMLVTSSVATAGLVVADFNDLNVAALGGQGGGSGFSGNWYGAVNEYVRGSDLTSNKYYITQSGNARLVQGEYDSDGRTETRNLATSMTGEIWFSFLAKNTADGGRAGICINNDTGSGATLGAFLSSDTTDDTYILLGEFSGSDDLLVSLADNQTFVSGQ